MADVDDELARLLGIARDFHFAMLTTIAADGHLHARPMTIAEIDEDTGTMWFLTSRDAEPCAEIRRDSRALVTMQSKDAYVQWSGHATLVDDPLRVHEVWDPTFCQWFPAGPEGGDLVLVRVDVEVGEYWDRSGAMKVRALLRRAASALVGSEPEGERAEREQHEHHGRVTMPNGHSRPGGSAPGGQSRPT